MIELKQYRIRVTVCERSNLPYAANSEMYKLNEEQPTNPEDFDICFTANMKKPGRLGVAQRFKPHAR